jgi:hypothetical protein
LAHVNVHRELTTSIVPDIYTFGYIETAGKAKRKDGG